MLNHRGNTVTPDEVKQYLNDLPDVKDKAVSQRVQQPQITDEVIVFVS
jgi:acyl-coenzyme A synthetase/AMP-(fatty) acid ligase